MVISKKEEILIKSEGVKDCVKWVEKILKETKKELDDCGDWEYHSIIQSRLEGQLKIKVGLERYLKKLRYEADEISNNINQ